MRIINLFNKKKYKDCRVLNENKNFIIIDKAEIKSSKEMIEYILKKKNITQQRLAKLLEVDTSQVTRWMNGAVPKIENQRKILKLYDEVNDEK